MRGRSMCSLVVALLLALTAGQALGSAYDRVAYWDGTYGTAWAGDGIAVRDALRNAGYTVVNAAELKTWMDARIADRKLSVVVMCRDAVPNTVAEAQNATCTIRKYLEAGGKVVWYSDIPFYYQSASTGTNTTWGDNGSINVLGFNASSATRDVNGQVTITEAGTRWGLTTPWSSTRPTGATVTPNLTILATDRNGAASGWVKHYVPGDTFRGFVRIEDHTGAPTNIANLIAVAEYLEVFTTAIEPDPSDGATDVPRDVALGWTPGEYAATHDVYFGTALADVANASRAGTMGVLASQDQAAAQYDPDGLLEYGQTYYWRIDEVNAAPDNTVFKGDVWRFTVEPFSYPIANVTATASSSQPGMGPQNTVNKSGLNANEQHSTESTHMWMSTDAKPHWIQYEFDKVYKLDELWVWNSNQLIEAFIGFGAKDVKIEYSTDGATWAELSGAPQFAQATGNATYTMNTTVDMGGVQARYVRLTINANWGGMAQQTGLSEVRFFSVPVQARAPQPAVGATGISLDTELNWRPGREATSHKVYFGSDEAAVAAGSVSANTVTEHSYTPASLGFGTKYYWKVDEVGDAGAYPGEVWNFTTQEYAAIDDFEAYNDDDNRIYNAWIDGLTNGNSGSTVGYFQAPFAEQTIVHSGKQSMPFEYNNVNTPFYSEAEQEFAPAQNWTLNGADTLSLWVRGVPAPYVDNAGVITMSAAGHDIWDNADDFRFAYKTLSGDGSILVKVESLVNTNNWAKAGVMIRQSLDADSKFVYFIVSYAQGVSMGWRPQVAGTCSSVTQAGIAAPQWVKLTRKGDVFTAQYSADGKTWTDLKNADGTVGSATVAMTNPTSVGLCVTSHNAAATTTAVMSGAATTGNVTGGSWQVVAIGDDPQPANSPADLYVTIQDSAGKTATAVNPTAVTSGAWTQWKIPLSSLTGVNFKAVKKMIIGAGSKTSPAKGGGGMLYIDDIGFGHPQQ